MSSCWNGVVAMKAAPFILTSSMHELSSATSTSLPIRFRTWREQEPRLLGRHRFGPLPHITYSISCPASECGLIFEDMGQTYISGQIPHQNQNRSEGMFFMHPHVHVTYSSLDWFLHSAFGGALNVLAAWTIDLHSHSRVPPAHRVPACGAARNDWTWRPWSIAVVAALLLRLLFYVVAPWNSYLCRVAMIDIDPRQYFHRIMMIMHRGKKAKKEAAWQD
jgi:hypothetical protein